MGRLFPILIVIYIIVSFIKFIAKSKEQRENNEPEEDVFEESPHMVKQEDTAEDFLRLLTGEPMSKPKRVEVARVKPVEVKQPPVRPKKEVKVIKRDEELLKEKVIKKYLIPGVELKAEAMSTGIIMAEILAPPVAKRKKIRHQRNLVI